MSNSKTLKMFQPGQSGNPSGRPPDPPELKEIKKLTKAELELILYRVLNSAPDDLDTKFENTVLEKWVASGAKLAIDQGDFSRLNWVIERLHGKIADVVKNEGEITHKVQVTRVDLVERIEQLKQLKGNAT